MMSGIRILDEHPLACDADGRLRSRIATVFPSTSTLITRPGIHLTQRWAYVDDLNQQRAHRGQPPLTQEEEIAAWRGAVDLIMEDNTIFIRPDPDNMALAFEADELLQKLVSKCQIKFLYVFNQKVRSAVKHRGECWRIAPLPTFRTEMKRRILASKIAIRGREIYYYNSTTGGRLLTHDEFARLCDLDDAELRRHLLEIREFSVGPDYQGKPEVVFFMADDSFSGAAFAPYDFSGMDGLAMRTVHEDLRRRFHDAVAPSFRHDDVEEPEWRNHMFSSLITEDDRNVPEERLLALSPEYSMQICWKPGAQFVNRQFRFDDVFQEEPNSAIGAAVAELRDENVRELLHNLAREYDDLEYVNIGRVINSLSWRLDFRGRRDVYLAVIKQHRSSEETIVVIRMQKWGVREYLDQGMSLERATYRSQEYMHYILNRRSACGHLGMNILQGIVPGSIWERYAAGPGRPHDVMIWTPYYKRAYVRGIATDKLPCHRFQRDEFALQFARLLGWAAAPNMIVGRCGAGGNVLFDDGDEILVEDERAVPREIIVTEHTGSFADYTRELQVIAPAYASPVNRRAAHLNNVEEFTRVYLDALVERFSCIQEKYRRDPKRFENIFLNRPYDEKGSFAYRWQRVLQRLGRSDPGKLADVIRSHVLIGARC